MNLLRMRACTGKAVAWLCYNCAWCRSLFLLACSVPASDRGKKYLYRPSVPTRLNILETLLYIDTLYGPKMRKGQLSIFQGEMGLTYLKTYVLFFYRPSKSHQKRETRQNFQGLDQWKAKSLNYILWKKFFNIELPFVFNPEEHITVGRPVSV